MKNKKLFEMFLFFCFLLFPRVIFIGSEQLTIDSSWILALRMSLEKDLVFGKEFIFTYGPMFYFLFPKFVSGFSAITSLFFGVINALFVLGLVWALIQNETKPKKALTLMVLVTLFGSHWIFYQDSMYFYLYILAYSYLAFRTGNKYFLIPVLFYTIISFYYKCNTGLIAVVYSLMFFVFMFYQKKLSFKSILGLIAILFVGLLGFSYLFSIDLSGYVSNSIHLIDAYNDAMVKTPSLKSLILVFGVVTSFVFVIFYLGIRNTILSAERLFFSLNILAYAFLLYKQNIVREDGRIDFFFSVILFVMLFYLKVNHTNETKVRNVENYMLLPLALVLLNAISIDFVEYRMSQYKNFFFQNEVTTLFGKKPRTEAKQIRKIPESITSKIGEKSVDVFPYEISVAYFNRLNYSPRPIIQSYSAYDMHLMEKNKAKFENLKYAPEVVLQHLGSIDDRNPFWDDAMCIIQFLKNYYVSDTFSTSDKIKFIVLNKRDTSLRMNENHLLGKKIKSKETLIIPKSENILMLKIKNNLSFVGKLKRFLFQPSVVYLESYVGEEKFKERLVMPVMEFGVPINKSVRSFDEMYSFYTSQNNLQTDSIKIIYEPRWFKEEMQIDLVEISLK
ncbi:MAG: hypothetical protein SNJ77_09845 [Cytophagales bacterium]